MISKNILLIAVFLTVCLSITSAQALCDDYRCELCAEVPSTCTKCIAGYQINLNTKSCTDCAPGFGRSGSGTTPLTNNSKCLKCLDTKCTSCTENYRTCLQCAEGFESLNGKCNEIGKIDLAKLIGCEFGLEQGKCDPTRCNTNRVFNQEKSGCDCQLDGGFIGQECLACTIPNCSRCIMSSENQESCANEAAGSATRKDFCERGYAPSDATLKTLDCDSCDTGYFKTPKTDTTPTICKPCSVKFCENCTEGREFCTQCKEGLFFDEVQKKCTCQMSDGQGMDLINGTCGPCLTQGCKTCDNNAVCTVCTGELILGLEGKECKPRSTTPTCDAGTVLDSTATQCVAVCREPGTGFNKAYNADTQGSIQCPKCAKANCGDCVADHSTCIKCAIGFKLNDKQECGPVCTEIGLGFNQKETIDILKPVCTKCTILNCADCQSDFNVCTTCVAIRFKKSADGKCVDVCSDPGMGFDPSKETTALPCTACKDPNCGSCTAHFMECAACKTGFEKSLISPACAQVCTTAGQGYNINFKVGGTVEKCLPCAIEGCPNCSENAAVCTACKPGFRINLEVKKCEPCVSANCFDCTKDLKICSKCAETFVLSNDGICGCAVGSTLVAATADRPAFCQAAVKCTDTLCASCPTSPDVCATCIEKHGKKFVENKSTCAPCSANCVICQENVLKCARCAEKFMLDGMGGCKEATTTPTCEIGLTLVNGVCVKMCAEHCIRCADVQISETLTQSHCQECVAPKLVGKLQGQAPRCFDKDPDSPTEIRPLGIEIFNCGKISYNAETKALFCSACPAETAPKCGNSDFIETKVLVGEGIRCERKFKSGVCQMEGCASCVIHYLGNDPNKTCVDVLFSTPICVKAGEGYRLATLNGKTVLVKNIMTSEEIRRLIPNCELLKPASSTTTAIECERCLSSYTLIGGACQLPECLKKFTNCEKCTVDKCQLCISGFELKLNACSPITCTLPNCQVCRDAAFCEYCGVGFKSVEGKCEECLSCGTEIKPNNCGPNCVECSADNICKVCAPGLKTAPYCDQCTEANHTFIQEKGVCVFSFTCVAPKIIQKDDAGKLTCIDGIPKCEIYGTPTACKSCYKGFYVDNLSKCSLCDKGCAVCTGSGACTQCYDRLKLENGKCLEPTITTTCTAEEFEKLTGCSSCVKKENIAYCTACQDATLKPSATGGCRPACTETQYLTDANACEDCAKINCASRCYNGYCKEKCLDGFNNINGKCVQATTAEKCDTTTHFLSVVDDKGTCVLLLEGAIQCWYDNFTKENKCSACKVGYRLNEKIQKCVLVTQDPIKPPTLPAPVVCLANQYKVGEKCVLCEPRKNFIKDNQCIPCQEHMDNWEECEYQDKVLVALTVTEKCPTNYKSFLNEDGKKTCIIGDPRCEQYENGHCILCQNRDIQPVIVEGAKYAECPGCITLTSSKYCLECGGNCLKCTQGALDQITCEECKFGFELKDQKCVEKQRACQDGLVMSLDKICGCPNNSQRSRGGVGCQCLEGFGWVNLADKTLGCVKKLSTEICARGEQMVNSKCVPCIGNYEVKEEEKVIIKYDVDYIAKCSGDIIEECRAGRYLDSKNNLCKLCEDDCEECTAEKCIKPKPGTYLYNGKVTKTLESGTAPELGSYYRLNFLRLNPNADPNEMLERIEQLKQIQELTEDKECEVVAIINDKYICKEQKIELDFVISESGTPLDRHTSEPIALETVPLTRRTTRCIKGWFWFAINQTCMQKCDIGYSVEEDATGQQECKKLVFTTSTVVKLATGLSLESRIDEIIGGASTQNKYSSLRIKVKSNLVNKKLTYSLTCAQVYAMPEPRTREEIPQDQLQVEDSAFLTKCASAQVQYDGDLIIVPTGVLTENIIYKINVKTTSYKDNGTDVDQTSEASILVPVIVREQVEALTEKTGKIIVPNNGIIASMTKQCAEFQLVDRLSFSQGNNWRIHMELRQLYVKSAIASTTAQNTYSCIFCFETPYTEVSTEFEVNVKLSFNGVTTIGSQVFKVTKAVEIPADKVQDDEKIKIISKFNSLTVTTIQETDILTAVNILAVTTRKITGDQLKEERPVSTTSTTTPTVETNFYKRCVADDPNACNKAGKCVSGVCHCTDATFDSMRDCSQQIDTVIDEQLSNSIQAANQLSKALLTISTSTDVAPEKKIQSSAKINAIGTMLDLPSMLTSDSEGKNREAVKNIAKVFKAISLNNDLSPEESLKAIKLISKTRNIARKLNLSAVKKRLLSESDAEVELGETEDAMDDLLMQNVKKCHLDKSADETETKIEVDDINIRVTNIKADAANSEFFSTKSAIKDSKNQESTINLPKQVLAKGQGLSLLSKTIGDRASTRTAPDAAVENLGQSFTIKVMQLVKNSQGKESFEEVQIADLQQPIQITKDLSYLPKDKTPCMLFRNKENLWVKDPSVKYNALTKTFTTSHLSDFIIGTESDIATPTTGTTTAPSETSTNKSVTSQTDAKPTVTVYANIFHTLSLILATVIFTVIVF